MRFELSTEQETSPIIVYGAPRSGTTYLKQILNQHPEVFISGEIRLFVWLHRSLNILTRQDQALYNNRERFVEHLREAYPELIQDFYRSLAPRARYWGDKNPHYATPHNQGCLDTIAALFPGTRFIHIVRDGRDVVTSNMRRGWVNFENSHSGWAAHVKVGSAFGASLPSSQYFELRYEDLIEDDVGLARKLFEFLEIEMHPKVVEFCEAQQERRTPLSGPTRDLSSDVTTSAWEQLLAPDQRLRSLELLGEHLVRYGYETEDSLARAKRELEELSEKTSIHPIRKVVRDTLPYNAIVLIVSNKDDDDIPLILDDHRGWHFPRTNHGRHAGDFANSEEAIAHLEELRTKRADYLLFPSTAFWWLDHYNDFRQHLEDKYPVVACQGGPCLIFTLQEPATQGRHETASETEQPLIYMAIRNTWDAGKEHELRWWREWVIGKGRSLHWPKEDYEEDYKSRLDPEQPLQDDIIAYLQAPPGATVSILDIGAGPLTKLGKKWEGRTVKITAVDPLADEYNRLLAECGIAPPVRTQSAEVERLTERFPANHFDLVYMQNALDHTYDPLLGIQQMLDVVKPGDYILLAHYVNEAEESNYAGLHQWNLCIDKGDFVIWNRFARISVNDTLGDVANITVDQSDRDIFVSLRKKSELGK